MGTEVTIEFDARVRAQGRFDPGIAERDLDRQQRRLEEKFFALTTPELGLKRARDLLEMLNGLDSLDSLDPLMELAR